MPETIAQGITWDLSDLYASIEDPKINEDLKLAETKAGTFQTQYKAPLESLKPGTAFPLAGLLKDYKEIVTLSTRPIVFAHLAFSDNTKDQKIGAFLQKTQEQVTNIHSHLLFFEVGWNKLDEKIVQDLTQDTEVQKELHFLETLRLYAPHTLSEKEEKIMAVKSNTGSHAFSRLFDEVINNIPFYIELDGQKTKKNETEVLALLHSKERDSRKRASESLAQGLDANTHILTYSFNMIFADHRTDLKIRDYKNPIDPRNLSNEVSYESIQQLIKTVKEAYPIAHRYYHLKKKLLGLGELFDYDRYAPIDRDSEKVPFDQCREIVLSGYYEFSEETGKIAEQFFTQRWIDAEVREGKRGGGFCCQTTPDLHPYILVNYTGSMRDVMTVAHEIGHGIHQYLAGKRVGILQSDAPLTMAETASVFGEMLIFEKILAQETDARKRLALICGKIDDNFATVYRQIAMTDFELMSHDAGLKQGELSSEKFSDLWMDANRAFYGDSVTLTDPYRSGWKYIPHFIHSPFYCYAYAFAQLFVLALYQKYKEDKASFIPKYLEMLSLGGSKKPSEIADIAGLNIDQPEFWQVGISLLDELVKEAENLSGSLV